MLGIDGAVEATRASLEVRVPTMLGLLQGAEEVPGVEVPKLYGGEQRARIEPNQYPAVLVLPMDTVGVEAIDEDDEGLLWRFTYRLRCWTFARNQSYERTERACRRLALAVREGLFVAPTLTEFHTLDRTYLRESFSGVGAGGARDTRAVAAAWVEVRVAAEERLSSLAPHLADTVVATVQPID